MEQGYQFGCDALDTKLFQKNDGTPYERLNFIYNVSRHYSPGELAAGDLHRVWISDDGLHVREKALSFDELRELLSELARIARAASSGVYPGLNAPRLARIPA